MSQWDNEVTDSWDRSALSIPAISWADHRKGDGFDGAILLPTPSGKFAGKGYFETPVMEPRQISVVRGGKTVMEDNPEYGKPRRWPDGRIMQQTVFTLLTDLKTLDYAGLVSEKAIERIETARKAARDDEAKFLDIVETHGLRRLYLQGASMDQGVKAAVRAVGRMPEVGATVSIRILDLEANPHGGRTKIFTVKYDKPTTESLAKVQAYLRGAATTVNDFLHVSQEEESRREQQQSAASTPTNVPAVQDDDEPPF